MFTPYKTAKPSIDWRPSEREKDYVRWDLPSCAWSGEEYGEDKIIIIYHQGEWSARTEMNQCVHRDLEEDEIASIREEFKLSVD